MSDLGRTLHIKADDGIYTDVRITDAEGKTLDWVTKVEWSVATGELCKATVHIEAVPADVTTDNVSYIVDMPDTQGVPLPEGLTVTQADAIRALFGGLASEYAARLEALKRRAPDDLPAAYR